MKKYVYLSFFILWMIIVFLLSHQTATVSSNLSGNVDKVVLKIFSIFNIENTSFISYLVTFFVRKIAHFTLYMVGGILGFLTLKELKLKNKKSIIFLIIFMIIFASSDEIHQYFIPGRSAELRDVFIDSIGAILGIFLTKKNIKINKKMEGKNE